MSFVMKMPFILRCLIVFIMSAAINLLGGANAVYAGTYSIKTSDSIKVSETIKTSYTVKTSTNVKVSETVKTSYTVKTSSNVKVSETVKTSESIKTSTSVNLAALSYGGTDINGKFYNGIDLRDYKITVHTITGKEKSSDFFNKDVSKKYRVNWKNVCKNYAIGTSIIVVTGIVSLCSPGTTAGYIAAQAIMPEITGAASFSAIDSLFSATLAHFNGEPKESVFKQAVEASSDGFMWGALTASFASGAVSLGKLKKLTPLGKINSKGKAAYYKNELGEVFSKDGGKPVGKLLAGTDKNGEYQFFYDEAGRLKNFKGETIAEKPVIEENGHLIKDKANNNKRVAYIDSKGVLNTTKNDIKNAIRFDKELKELTPEKIKELSKPIIVPKTGKLLCYQYKKTGLLLSETGQIIGNIHNDVIRDSSGKIIGYFSKEKGLLTSRKAIKKALNEEWDSVKSNFCPSRRIKGINKNIGYPGSGEILGENIESCNIIKLPKFAQAHHIVPKAVEGKYGEAIRKVLERYDVDINDCRNGIPLPGDAFISEVLGLPLHSGPVNELHGEEFMEYLNKKMSKAKTQADVFKVLSNIKASLCNNKMPWLK